MDSYALEKLTGWTPELSPPPDSPFYRWRVLAGHVVPGRVADANPESRDSPMRNAHLRSGPSDHPGMTTR
jgi:hypothetical protein